jgi:hypothetical protein
MNRQQWQQKRDQYADGPQGLDAAGSDRPGQRADGKSAAVEQLPSAASGQAGQAPKARRAPDTMVPVHQAFVPLRARERKH